MNSDMHSAVLSPNPSRGAWLLEIQVTLTFSGPLHVGTGERLSLSGDAPILRDADRQAWLPGSSIRGVLRDWCRREAPLLDVDPIALSRLFGATPDAKSKTTADRQGRLRVFDARVAAAHTEIRDHVQIDRETGAGKRGGKFDLESADITSAAFRLTYEGEGERDPEMKLLRAAMAALRSGLLAFGGKTGWGLGAVTAGVTARVIDRRNLSGCASYLASRLGQPAGVVPFDLGAADYSVAPRKRSPTEPAPWSWLGLDLSLQFDGPMLVAGMYRDTCPGPFESEADATYIVGIDGRPVLPGSALRGTLRTHAERIATTLGDGAQSVARALFGFVDEMTNDAKRGLLRVGEGILVSERRPAFLNHVAIDRVTGFAADQKLFSATALASPRFETRVFVRWNHDDELERAAIGLLLLVLRDAEQEQLWVGSRTTRGYGWLKQLRVTDINGSLVTPAGSPSGRQAMQFTLPAGLLSAGDLTFAVFLEAWRKKAQIQLEVAS